AQFLSGAYRVPAIAVEALVMLSNKTPTGTYRGPGRFEADFFRERLFDLVAADLGIDRVEFRRRNLPSAAEMPYRLADIAPAARGDELDSGDYQVTLERCLAEFGWEEKQKLSGKLIDGVYHGLGFVCFIEGGAAGPSEMSRMVLEADGTISVYVGSSSVGQGVETAFSQIVADALQVPIEKIRGIFHGSTAHVREGYGSFHSRAVVMGGSAMLLAAAKLLDGIRAAAAAKLGCAAADVVIEDGERATAGGRSVALADLAGVTAEGEFHNHKHTWAYGAHAAHVAVDPATGAVQVVDYAAVEDAGRIINPKMLRGQLYGAVAQGLGGVFMEHFTYDDQGQPQSTTLADYVMPTACEVPRIKAVVLEDSPSPINPLGAKGAGEGGIIPTGGVIANAIADALSSIGVQPHDLPLSPPRVLRMIEDAKAKA
ncbi:MAG: xanthine dehydrogenase family protein molybdopterin-binding subunit, partial [Rhodospirillaceae bacterium]